jgi:methylmalonyl-CoA mutase N-terminal domain/subunit
VSRSLGALRTAAGTRENLMPRILDAVRAYATVGEMCDALRQVWGEYEEVPII